MLVTRLYLRNFRVYEQELDLLLPPGLVGIYGPNGSGKSTLLEAIVWTLWGKARTTKEQIRSTGVGGDCITEVEFEHEGHLYLVRRVLTGANSTPRLQAHCDGLIMSEGVRDAQRYIQSVLGMDDSSFRASVFAEQKQLAAFSDRRAEERRALVLRLLGITPLDKARDAARKDARRSTDDHQRLRGMLPDLDVLTVEAADAEAKAAASEATSESEKQAATTAEQNKDRATKVWEQLDLRRQEHETLVIEGRAVRQEKEASELRVAEIKSELAQLDTLALQLDNLDKLTSGLADAERELGALQRAVSAAVALARLPDQTEPPPVDEEAVELARSQSAAANEKVASLSGFYQGAEEALRRANELAQRSASLSGEADCPVCGQELGDAFEKVQAHRAIEVEEAARRAEELGAQLRIAQKEATRADARKNEVVRAADTARRVRSEWERAESRRREAEGDLRESWAAVRELAPDRPGEPPDPAILHRDTETLKANVGRQQEAAEESKRLRVRLERRAALQSALESNQEKATVAAGRVQALRDKVKALGFESEALTRAALASQQATAQSKSANERAQRAALEAATARAGAESAARALQSGREQHAKLAELESQARHLSRVADLLSEFRNTIVASVGPRLAAQAAELFAELTDHEYDELQVDPDNYQLQISDAGQVYGLERFSGSEIDLANLALRVAISEHIHFQSGGSVGLMVLDEVFGPLDEDRKARMLLALDRLRGRFRQVLVVTHDAAIKEQLPNAIEVVKLPGRRATARSANV